MRKVVLTGFGGPEVLRLSEAPEPELPADGWIVELRAIGLNFAELVERRGLYRKDQRLPYEIGKEAAGVIVAKGARARGFELGQSVIVIRFSGGCYAERVAVQAGQVLRAPAHLNLEECAAFAIAYITAWYAQEELARARPGESALIQAAAGATGSAAVRLAKARGLGPVIGTAGGPEKAQQVLALGADQCIDYQCEALPARLAELTHKRGVDYCLESVGGQVFEQSLQALSPMGRLVAIGFSSIDKDHAERIKRVHPLQLFLRSWGLFGLNVENLDFPRRLDVWERLLAVVEAHELRPLVGARFPLAEAAQAHAAIETRRTAGKVLLIP
jgi:NADPH:quinone reductase-like Zn-dependent oxidoreductase